MVLPDTRTLNFFNKVLISLSDLSPSGEACSMDTLSEQCKAIAFGGQIGDYESIFEHCQASGLLQVKRDQVIISLLGQRFLDANRERFFEITEAQKHLIVERIVFRGSWSHFARELFQFFVANFATETYELAIDEVILPVQHNSTLHLLKHLGVLRTNGALIIVDKKYTELVYQLTADAKAITEQQLEKILMENRKLGAKAENATVEFERQRLRKLGKFAHAELVKRISTMNEAAGYDIESFDGTSDDFIPNRFIEVKATQSDEIRFYWTSNELKVAKKKKNAYWIYMFRQFKEDKPEGSPPIMIQNPDNVIPRHALLSMEVNKYLVSEVAEIELEKCNIEEIIWYQLF